MSRSPGQLGAIGKASDNFYMCHPISCAFAYSFRLLSQKFFELFNAIIQGNALQHVKNNMTQTQQEHDAADVILRLWPAGSSKTKQFRFGLVGKFSK